MADLVRETEAALARLDGFASRGRRQTPPPAGERRRSA